MCAMQIDLSLVTLTRSSSYEERRRYFFILILVSLFLVVFAYWFFGSAFIESAFRISNQTGTQRTCLFVILILIVGLIFAFAWALNLYISLKGRGITVDLSLPADTRGPEYDPDMQFHTLAHEHQLWSQLWFTISICILVIGVIYALSHMLWVVTEHSGEGVASLSWSVVTDRFIENFFAFSLFYIAWNWSVRHFRAHWHNFILNAYRFRALGVLRNMMDDVQKAQSPDAAYQLRALRKMAGLLLLLTESSAYLDTEQEQSLLERVSKLEDALKKVVTGA